MSYAIMFVTIFALSYLFFNVMEGRSGDIPSEFDGDPMVANEKYRKTALDDIYRRHSIRFLT